MNNTVILYLLVAAVCFLGAELRTAEKKIRELDRKVKALLKDDTQTEKE